MEAEATLAPVLLVVGLAFVVPILLNRFRRLHIPVVVGEILAGMIIGRSGLQLVHEDPVLEVLAALGFAFLMFLSGLEIDFSMLSTSNRDVRSAYANPIVPGFLILALTIAMAMAFATGAMVMGFVKTPWLLALILSTTSLGIVLPVLREQRLSTLLYGQTILLAALIADFVTMLLITVVVAVLSGGLTLEVLLVGVLLVAFFLATRFARRFSRWEPMRRTLDEMAHATVQIKVRGALAVMFTFVVLSEVLGAEVILGAFLAGALIALVSSPEDSGDIEAKHKLDAIGFGFIIPIFFIMVGVRFDLPALLESASALALFPILLVAAYAVKVIPALILRQRFSWREAVSAGVLLSSRLSLIIAASAIGLRLGIISDALNADIVLVAIVTSTISPALFSRIYRRKEEVAAAREYLVVGTERTSLLLGQRLAGHGEPVVFLDHDAQRVEHVRRMGFQARLADATRSQDLADAGIEHALALAVTTPDDEFNLKVCQVARSTFGVQHLVAHVHDPTYLRQFEATGAHAVNGSLATVSVIDGILRFPDALNLLTSLEDDKDVVEITMRNPSCGGRKLRDMQLPGDVTVLAIRRDGELLVPHGYNTLELHDQVTLLGDIEAVEEAANWLSQAGALRPIS